MIYLTAEWCPACRDLKPKLEAAVAQHRRARLYELDIKSWDTPLAKQFGARGLKGIPYVEVYRGRERVPNVDRRNVVSFVSSR